jgi:hypothetical protein
VLKEWIAVRNVRTFAKREHMGTEPVRAAQSVCRAMSLGFVIFITTGQPANAIVIGPPVQIGTTTSPLLVETSGVVGSRAFPGVLWMHGDSGDSARFSAVASDGTLLAQYFLDGATNHDWEDLAIGPKPGGGSYLYFGDIGDNNRVRASLQIYRTAEPTSLAGGVIPSSQYDVREPAIPGAPCQCRVADGRPTER